MNKKKYIKMNVTITYCFNAEDALSKDRTNVESVQNRIDYNPVIAFFPDEGDTCTVNSVELISE